MNIVLVIIDTLRYDYVGANGNDWIRTPNLDALAERSWVFDRCFASSYPTIPHRTDLITGRCGDPFHAWMPLRFDVPTMPAALAEAGYCTQLIHDTPHLVNGGHGFDWAFHAWQFIRGAEVDRPRIDDEALTYLPNWKPDPMFDYAGDPKIPGPPGYVFATYMRANRHRRRDEDWNAAQLFLTAAQRLRENANRDNFFLWVDSFDPHEPWDAPPQFVRMYDDTPGYDGTIDPRAFAGRGGKNRPQAVSKRIAAMYAAKVSWVDHCLGRMLEALEQTPLAANTAVIVTADHGTNVGERGKFGKQRDLHEQEGHVPLMVSVPGRGKGRSDILVQPQDITATILALAGAEPPPGLDGHDVLALAEAAKPSPRPIALAGRAACTWKADPAETLFTVFDEDGYLMCVASREHCRLFGYGELEPEPAPDAARVEKLRQLALAEVRRRSHPDLLAWLRDEGSGPFPQHCCNWPGPKGWQQYWNRLYMRW